MPDTPDLAPDPAIHQFLEYMQLRGRRPRTRDGYEKQLLRVQRWLAKRGKTLLTATAQDLQDWRAELGVAPNTVATYGAIAKSFFSWGRRSGFRIDDPTLDLILPTIPRGLPNPIGEADLRMVIETAPARIRPWLVLAGFAGMRACEIADLRREHLLDTADPAMIMIGGKGGHWRLVPLAPFVWGELLAAGVPSRGFMFGRRDGKLGPNRAHVISQLCNEHIHACGITDKTLHSCRHRFGTRALHTSGNNLRLVQELLGHASVQSTQIYTAFTSAAAVEAVLALQPDEPIPNLAA